MPILGQKRRDETKDNLAGQSEIKPVMLQLGGIQAPRKPSMPTSAQDSLINALGAFASKSLKATVNARKERAILDGQAAYVQGRSLDEVTGMGGDKHAREGYKIIDASTTASALVAAQLVKIEQDGSVTANQWRANYGAMVEATVQGKEPRTATLIRDAFASKLGQLVARQTVAHEKWLEQKTFDSVVNSIDIISQDADGEGVLLNITGFGEDSAGAFLSDDRKKAAISRGIQRSFLNGNPVAYGILRTAGVLNELTNEQRNAVENAKNQWQNKLRSEANSGMVQALEDVVNLATKGKLDYNQAVMRYSEILVENGIDIKAIEQKMLYAKVQHADDMKSSIKAIDLDNAIMAGDFDVAGEIMADIMQLTESRNRDVEGPLITRGANAGTRAHGPTQITTLTSKDPGYGVRPARNNSPAELQRTGREYWKALYKGKLLGIGNLPWEAGDWLTTAVAYNWGPDNAQKWFRAGSKWNDLPKETKEYITRMKGYVGDMKNPTLAGKLNAATHLQAQNKIRGEAVALDEYFQRVKPVEEVLRQTGDIEFYRDQMEFERQRLKIELSKGLVQNQNQRQDAIMADIATVNAKENVASAQAKYKVLTHDPLEKWARVANNPNSTPDERIQADMTLLMESQGAMTAAGVSSVATETGKIMDKINEAMLRMQEPLRKRRQELAEQEHAQRTGNLNHLNDKGKTETIEQAKTELETALHEFENKQAGNSNENEAGMRDRGSTEYAKLYSKYQFVDKETREAYSAAINRGLTLPDGRLNPDALQAIMTYRKIKAIDGKAGTAAEQFLNEDARTMANSVIFLAGPSGPLEEAMVTISKELMPATKADIDAIVKADGFEKEVRSSINNRIDDDVGGFLHGIWSPRSDLKDIGNYTGDEMDSLADPANQDQQVDEVTQEATRLVTKFPRHKAQWILDTALENVAARSANIGRNWIIMKKPILQQMFGDKARNFDKDGIAHEVVVEYLKKLSKEVHPNGDLVHPGITDIGGVELTNMLIRDAISIIPGVEWSDGLARQESLDSIARGLRPFYSMVDVHRDVLNVEIVGRDGLPGPSIQIDLRKAGDHWRDLKNPRWTQAGQDAEDATILDFGIIDSP